MTDPTDRGGDGIWTRLRRRKVVQWGVAYAAGAWAVLQGIGFVADAFSWPGATKQIATLALLFGIPIALVIAWYHGDRGEQRVSGAELTIIVLLLLLGGGLLWHYQRPGERAAAAGSATGTQAPMAKPAGTPAAEAPAADARPSIAVLPFENRSDEHEDAYFVDGIHDDILTQLSKVSALKVISRTSVERFRNTELSLQQVAEQLGVTSILEGAVQRAGERVRINVQLIDAGSDAHLWAETYDRELTPANIFGIQSEVAAAIASALEATLTTSEEARVNAVPTRSLEAWESYQRGRQRMARRTSVEVAESLALFQRSIDADPDFALAYVALAQGLLIQVFYEYAPIEASLAAAEKNIGKALALDPNLAEAHASLANLCHKRGDAEHAEVEYRKAIELNPNYATAYHWYSLLLMWSGRFPEALQAAQRAEALDPLSAIINNAVAHAFDWAGRFDEARAGYRKALGNDPAMPVIYSNIANLHAYAYGRFDDAVPWLKKAIELDPDNAVGLAFLSRMYLDLGDDVGAEQLLGRVTRPVVESASASQAMAMWHLYQGDYAGASALAGQSLAIDPRWAWPLRLLRDADLGAGDWQAARTRYAKAFPELLAAAPPKVDGLNYGPAVDLALVLQQTGERSRGNQLLDGSARYIRTIPRMGVGGYGITDAQILALRGERREALAALRQAEKSGWRADWRYYRDFDPALASIRHEPAFKAVFVDIDRDMADQRARLAARPKIAPLALDAAAVH